MVGAPLKPLALLTLASWMRKAHRLCKARDKSSKDPLVWYPNRRDILATAFRLKAKLGGGIWMKSQQGACVSFCKSRWVNLMARGFFLLPWDESLFGLITGTGTKIRAIKIARAFVAFFSLSFLIQCIYLLKQLLSHNVTHTHTRTDTHTTAVCRCYLGCGCASSPHWSLHLFQKAPVVCVKYYVCYLMRSFLLLCC